MIDLDTFPPQLCEREDCCNPSSCICHPDEPCQHDMLPMIAPKRRDDVENPPRG